MGRLVVVVAVALLVTSVAAGEEYLYWYYNPQNMGGTVGTAVSVEGGQNLLYTITSTDKDTAYLMEDGEKEDEGLFVDPTFWVFEYGNKPHIMSCPTGYWVTLIGFDGASGTYTREFHGVAQQWIEQQTPVLDSWWFDDVAMIGPEPDGGSRDDAELGPLQKTVTLTPSVGWVYGTVKDQWGGAVQCQVQLYQNGQPTGYQADADGNGMYTIHYVYAGSYVARANWGMGGEANAAVTKGQGTQADIVLQGGP